MLDQWFGQILFLHQCLLARSVLEIQIQKYKLISPLLQLSEKISSTQSIITMILIIFFTFSLYRLANLIHKLSDLGAVSPGRIGPEGKKSYKY